MADRREQLLSILQKSNGPLTGKQLSEIMKCSSRTVINYVNQINGGQKDPIIKSSQDGYYINSHAKFQVEKDDIPQDKQQRMFYILKTLLLSKDQGVDAFDLADELMISYSLLKKEISEFNANFKSYEISIVSKKNILTVSGRERNKRKAMSAFIREMQSDTFLTNEKLKAYFGDESIEAITEIIQTNVKKEGGHIDDFALLNLLLHISIMVNRLRVGDSLTEQDNYELGMISPLASHIISALELYFRIQMNETEKKQITALIISHVHLQDETYSLSGVEVDEELIAYLTGLVQEVKKVFCMDFTNENFMVPFVLHVQNLLVRLKNDISVDNPIKETIRNTAPFLYDVAVYLLDSIMRKYQIDKPISDNEFTFVVIHLALEIERQNKADSSVGVLLYLPQYLGIEKKLSKGIIERFESSVRIVGIVNQADEIQKYQYDVVVSFVNVQIPLNKRFIKISPLLTNADYELMSESFTQIQQEKLVNGFKNVFPFFFEKENFLIEHQDIDKYEAIRRLCSRLEKNRYVTGNFVTEAIKREEAISTGYKNFALPHSVSPSVLTQTVAVMIHPEGIEWDEKKVYCVMLMAVDPKTLSSFQNMYNGLLLILTESDCQSSLKLVRSFESFRELMLNAEINL